MSGLLKGGADLGALTLLRWYAAHVFLLPACLIGFTVAHIYLMRRQGISGPIKAAARSADAVLSLPRAEGHDRHRGRLRAASDAGDSSSTRRSTRWPIRPTPRYVPRPEWYFMSLFELLKHFPGTARAGRDDGHSRASSSRLLFLLPFLDRRPERAPGKRPIVIASFVLVFTGIGAAHLSGIPDHAVSARRKRSQAARGRARRARATEPLMVEDVFKNVQALKGITVDEFMGTMGLMSASLGLCCNDCHPGAGTDGGQSGKSDKNPRKVTARQMVFMVQAINRDNFSGRQAVTCWTCHRLRLTPVQTPRLDQFYSEAITELDDAVPSAQGVPTPDAGDRQVSAGDRRRGEGGGHHEHRGDRQGRGIRQLRRRRQLRILRAGAGQARHAQPPSGWMRAVRTFDGANGWFAIPLAVVPKYPLTGGELDGARLDAQLSFPAQIAHSLTGLRVGPRTDIDGKDVFLLQGNGERGAFVSLYFDAGRPGCSCGPSATRRRRSARCRRRWTTRITATSVESSFPTSGRSRGWTAATCSRSPT